MSAMRLAYNGHRHRENGQAVTPTNLIKRWRHDGTVADGNGKRTCASAPLDPLTRAVVIPCLPGGGRSLMTTPTSRWDVGGYLACGTE